MDLPKGKRTADEAFGNNDSGQSGSDDETSSRTILEKTLGKLLYWRLRPLERFESFPVPCIFPWGIPRDIWELIAAYLDKPAMDALALVNRACRKQVWHTRHERTLSVPEGRLSVALDRIQVPFIRDLVKDHHSISMSVLPAELDLVVPLLSNYTHVSKLTLRCCADAVPFSLPFCPSLRALSLTLTKGPLPLNSSLPSLRSICMELTRWREPPADIATICMQSNLRVLKLFVNNICCAVPPAPTPLLDMTPCTKLSHLEELHIVSYQLSRPQLCLPLLPSVKQLELHSLSVAPCDLEAYHSLTSLRLSLLSVPDDLDAVLSVTLQNNGSLVTLGISGGESAVLCRCLSCAPKTLERLAFAPSIDFKCIVHLTKLTHLDLRSCSSAVSHDSLSSLSSLRTLVLDDRPPVQPQHLSYLRSLKNVWLVPSCGDAHSLVERVRAAAPNANIVVNPPEQDLEL